MGFILILVEGGGIPHTPVFLQKSLELVENKRVEIFADCKGDCKNLKGKGIGNRGKEKKEVNG